MWSVCLIHRSKQRGRQNETNMSQMTGQKKTPEKELNKMEATNLLDTEFKTLAIRIFSALREK